MLKYQMFVQGQVKQIYDLKRPFILRFATHFVLL